MTADQTDLIIRPVTGPGELELLCRLPYVRNSELAGDLRSGSRRPEWMWVALRGDRLVARAAWWGRPGSTCPASLDVFDLADAGDVPDRVDIGARLLTAAMTAFIPEGGQRPEYGRLVPPGWRDHAASRRPVEDRMAAVQRTGGRLLVERLELEWRSGAPIAEPTGRLAFRPAGDRAELIGLMALAIDGTLDAHGQAELARMPAAAAAARQYEDELARYQSPRDWWRIAVLPGGEPVGFVVPAHNGYDPIIAYLGVVPAHRGHGYVAEILAEGTRVLAGQDVPLIRANTDLANVPMAQAFGRAGWVTVAHEINMTWN